MHSKRDPQDIMKDIESLVKEYHESKFGEEKFIPGQTRIDPSGKIVGLNDLNYGVQSILDGWWTEGRFAKKLRESLAGYIGVRNALLANSGSSANLLALSTLTSRKLRRRVDYGSEVISCATSFPTTVNPIVQVGAVPVFLDAMPIETGQYNPDCSRLEEAVNDKTRAIFFAHTLGNPFDIDRVMEVARKHDLYVIEDCCDALGSTWDGKKVGSFGELSTLSMYPAHHITAGEMGAVFTDDAHLAKIANSMRNWGRHCWCEPGVDNTCGIRFGWKVGRLPKGYDHKNTYDHIGYNLKPTDMQAAIALGQFGSLENFIARRKDNFSFLYKRLEKYQDKIILPEHMKNADPSWFGFLISVRGDAGFSKMELVKYLENAKIMSRDLFGGNMTRQPSLGGVNYKSVGDLKNSDDIMERTFWIGVQPRINEDMREYMADTFDNFFSREYRSPNR